MMNTIILYSPLSKVSEREYIYKVVFEDFLGVDYSVEFEERNSILIDLGSRKIEISDVFLNVVAEQWLQPSSLPESPFDRFQISDLSIRVLNQYAEIPVLFGSPEFSIDKDTCQCKIDIFGSMFFLLSRYEEYVIDSRDNHDRFQVEKSVLYNEGLYLRPLANEYLELLWGMLSWANPNIKRMERLANISLSHDVDRAFEYYFLPCTRVFRISLAELFRRRSMRGAVKMWWSWIVSKVSSGKRDAANTYDYLMTCSETRGIKSTFNFIVDSDGYFDRPYDISNSKIKTVIDSISSRGHQIGFHGGYGTYLSPEQSLLDIERLKMIANDLGVEQSQWEGRQHYLQCRLPESIRTWAAAGLAVDSSLGFSEDVGFRCAICYPYPLYDLEVGQVSSVYELPLMVMDATILAENNCFETQSEIVKKVKKVKDACRFYQGTFVFLWHNSNLEAKDQRDLYEYILDL